jgi:hypothetical protein
MAITEVEVKKIIKTSLPDISGQIATADTLLQAAFAQALLPVPTPEALYDTIGTWLAAHFVAISDPRFDNLRRTQYGAEYWGGKLGTGLLHTSWGQMACVLDTTGTLAGTDPTACMEKCSGGIAGGQREARIIFV